MPSMLLDSCSISKRGMLSAVVNIFHAQDFSLVFVKDILFSSHENLQLTFLVSEESSNIVFCKRENFELLTTSLQIWHDTM